jgi:hypothetical protein
MLDIGLGICLAHNKSPFFDVVSEPLNVIKLAGIHLYDLGICYP